MKGYIVYCVELCLIIIMVCMSGCGYSNEKVSQATPSETVIENTETEDDSVEIYKGKPQYQYEIQTIEVEDIASESIFCENVLAGVENGYDNEEICGLYKDIISECEALNNERKDNLERDGIAPN
ncbi:MAG: hypothetical protein PUF45_02965 [Lachnospiraceae bacterium]|nr:hypothetical protein [Lachnospiraceae bacterium]